MTEPREAQRVKDVALRCWRGVEFEATHRVRCAEEGVLRQAHFETHFRHRVQVG